MTSDKIIMHAGMGQKDGSICRYRTHASHKHNLLRINLNANEDERSDHRIRVVNRNANEESSKPRWSIIVSRHGVVGSRTKNHHGYGNRNANEEGTYRTLVVVTVSSDSVHYTVAVPVSTVLPPTVTETAGTPLRVLATLSIGRYCFPSFCLGDRDL